MNASSYEHHRPSYPPEAVDSLLTHLQVQGLKGARIVDLASGTGKLTELLANRTEEYEIICVEPHKGMRDELLKKNLKGVTVSAGEASRMLGIENQSVDAVVAAQVSFIILPKSRDIYETLCCVESTDGAFSM